MAYFDNAATTYPKPDVVYLAMDNFYRNHGGSYGRGFNKGSLSAGALVKETRELIKTLLHCSSKEVIFTATATIALNIVVQGLIKKGIKNVYISPFEHNAVTRILHAYEKDKLITVHQLFVDNCFRYDFEKISYQFDDIKPELVIINHASNVFGLISPVEKICNLAKQYKAITVVDMAQTAGLVDCNIGLYDIDFAIFAGHKTLYGPTGISGFVMNPSIILEPVLFGGTGFDSSNKDMPFDIPQRYEMGTLNISGIAGLNASLKWINEKGIDEIFDIEKLHRKKLLEILSKYDFLKIIGVVEENQYVGIVSVLINGISSDIAAPIFEKNGISVRTGLQCAPLAHKFLGTFPTGTIRFSVSYFNTDEDFLALENALDYIGDNI